MAIKAYNAGVEDTSAVPEIDISTEMQDGDMLYFDKENNVFRAGRGIVLPTKLSQLQNDREFVTEYQMTAAIANAALDSGNIDFNDFASVEYVDHLFNQHTTDHGTGSGFSGNYDDLINKPSLFSGDYNDLINKPVYPDTSQFLTQAQITTLINAEILDLNLFSGNYNDLTNKPTIPDTTGLATTNFVVQQIDSVQDQINAFPTAVSAFINDAGYSTTAYVDAQIAQVSGGGSIDLSGYVTDTELQAQLTSLGARFSGDYNDLTNKPAIPSLTGYATELYVQQQVNQVNTFSGDYNDLTNKPAIPSLTGYATVAYVDSQIPDTSTFATKLELTNALADHISTVDLNNALVGYATEAWVTQQLANYQPTVDLTNYYTKAEADAIHASIAAGGTVDLTGYVTDVELAAALANYQPTVDLTPYALKTELFDGQYSSLTNLPTIPTDINQLTDTSGLLGQGGGNVDLSNYYTKAETDALIPTNTDSQILTLTGNTLTISGGNSVDLSPFAGSGTVDLTGYATETYVNTQISAATLSAGGISNLDDLNDVAVGSLPQVDNDDEFYLLEYNPVNALWESKDFGSVFATQSYVSATVATALTNGTINLDGYATEQYVEQKLLERGHHFSGNYNDLVNRPILFSGDYRDLINTPADNSDLRLVLNGTQLQLMNIEPEPDTVISTVELEDLGESISSFINYQNVQNLPNIFSGDYNDLINRPHLFSGNYNDLANKPYIPSIAGLSSIQYVDNRIAEPDVIGDKYFKNDIFFEGTPSIIQSTANTTGKKSEYVFAVETTDATEQEVAFSDGSFITIPDNTTAKFTATYVCTSRTVHSSFTISGIVHKHSGTLTAIGNNVYEITADSDLGWTGNVTVDTFNNRVRVTVQGSENTTVDWVIFVEMTEVTA